jgi:hypothetical protein
MHIDIFKNKSPRPLCALRYIDGKPVAHCIFDSARRCRSCGRYRELAPAIGVHPESSKEERLGVEI